MTLLECACGAAADLRTYGSTRGDKELIQVVMSHMAHRTFMSAVADAARGMSAIAAYLPSDAAGAGGSGQEEPSRLALGNASLNSTRTALARYAALMVQRLVDLLSARGPRCSGGRESSGAVLRTVSPLVGVLAETQLLAAAASAVLGSPHPIANNTLPPDVADMIYGAVRSAVVYAATAVVLLLSARCKLKKCGGRDGRRLAAVLLRMARHEAVQRLQVALLDQLAAHAGLGAELGPAGEEGQEEGPGQQGQGAGGQQGADQQRAQQEQQQQAGEAWMGTSGAWWFAREEAERGQLLGLVEGVVGQGPEAQVRSSTAGWLEDYHCQVVFSTLFEWSVASAELAEEAGVLAWPPPLLTARLAARAAEALCRLCRGEGLDGAYAPAPEWQFAASEVGGLRFYNPGHTTTGE